MRISNIETTRNNNVITSNVFTVKNNISFDNSGEFIKIGKRTNNETNFLPVGSNCIAIGNSSGDISQNDNAIAIGFASGLIGQQHNSIAIGVNSGNNNQGNNSIAIGNGAGFVSQGNSSIAIGQLAGNLSLGENSIAIGKNTGFPFSLPNNSISLNATGSILFGQDSSNAFYVAPVREKNGNYLLQYNTDKKEITYSNNLDLSGGIIYHSNNFSPPIGGNNSLADVLDVDNVANRNIDMSNNYILFGDAGTGVIWNTGALTNGQYHIHRQGTTNQGIMVVNGAVTFSGQPSLGTIVAGGVPILLFWRNGSEISSTTVSSTTYTTISQATVSVINTSGYCSHSAIQVTANISYSLAGNGDDSFESRILIDGTEAIRSGQQFRNAGGGGTRSGTLFMTYALRTKQTNSPATVNVQIQVRVTTGADSISIFGGYNGFSHWSIYQIPFPRTSN